MNNIRYKFALIFLVFLSVLITASFADESLNAKITITDDPSNPSKEISLTNPSISRFAVLKGVIPPEVAGKIYKASIKIYINNVDMTLYLQKSSDNESIILTYDPIKELPLGKVDILIKAVSEDNTYSQKVSFTINPGADKSLTPFYKATLVNPRSVQAHINFAKAYEKKKLLKDAAYEYRRALSYSPRNKTALENWIRVFTSLDKKSITIRNITLDASILPISKNVYILADKLIFIKLSVINNSHEIVKFDPADTLLIVDNDYQVRPVDNIYDYPVKMADLDLISAEQFAQMKYFLDPKKESGSFASLEKKDVQPSIALNGYLAYPLKYPKFKYLSLWVRVKTDPKVKITFRVPFKKL